MTIAIAAWRTWILNRQATALSDQARSGSQLAEVALKQSEIAWKGQLADRFIKTAPLLGGEEINERIGALIALEEIAKHSEEHRWSIIELIASFIRESVTIGIKPRPGAGKILNLAQTDVAHALDVIGRLNKLTGQEIEEINLSSCNFRNYVFSGNFSKAALNRCVLDSVLFKKCQLFGTSLVGSFGVVQFEYCHGRLNGASEEWNGRFDGTQNFPAQIGLKQEPMPTTAGSVKVRPTMRRKARGAQKSQKGE